MNGSQQTFVTYDFSSFLARRTKLRKRIRLLREAPVSSLWDFKIYQFGVNWVIFPPSRFPGGLLHNLPT